jgi:hypothetical protein
MLEVNSFNSHVSARMLDFVTSPTQWHRRLWCTGLSLTLSEVLEASEAFREGILSADSLKTLTGSAIVLAGTDAGCGDAEQKRLLQQSLKPDLPFYGLDFFTVRDIARDIERSYLKRWSDLVDQPASVLRPERLARAICSHLLDAGFSSDHLHRWWTYKTKHEAGNRKLGEVISDAHNLVSAPHVRYEILIAFESLPKTATPPPRWLDATSVSSWIRRNGFENSTVRQRGGMLITLLARDATSAVENAEEMLDKISARVAVGVKGSFRPLNTAWVAGQLAPFPIGQRRRVVQIHALHREDQIYSSATPNEVDAAIELLAPLSSSSPAAAVAGGWAAIEALLSEPNDRGSAAARMASIVACSYPRAELTPLSFTVEAAGGTVAQRLSGITKSRDRCEILARAIQDNQPLPLKAASDVAAAARIGAILAAPQAKLKDIESHLCVAFRRLYRQRNLILHGGKTGAVALRACLRTIAPLVGAGMDRIAHAWFVERIAPLELAARARIGLSQLTPRDAVHCIDLLS